MAVGTLCKLSGLTVQFVVHSSGCGLAVYALQPEKPLFLCHEGAVTPRSKRGCASPFATPALVHWHSHAGLGRVAEVLFAQVVSVQLWQCCGSHLCCWSPLKSRVHQYVVRST
jgi:hypothetical protein